MTAFLEDQVLLGLILTILLLLGLAAFFACFSIALRIRNDRETRLWAGLKKRWEPSLMNVLTDPQGLPALWEKVEPKNHLHFLEFVLRYAQRLGGTERAVLKEAAAPYLPEVLPHLKHRQMGIRARAVQTLGTLGLPKYMEELRKAMEDPSPFVAAMAARLLAHGIGPEVAEDLCRSLPRFGNFRIWYLVDLMVALGPDAIPSIRRTMGDPTIPNRTRAVAALSLSALRDLGAADPAAELATSESDPELLSSLLRLLAQVGTSKHAEAVRPHLDSEEFFVRAAATRTLSELGSDRDLPRLVEQLADPSTWVRVAAARGVYRLGGRAALSALVQPGDPATPLFRQVLAEEAGQ